MKIVTIVGARPQFIKAAVVSRAISKRANICESIIHTGQHFDTNMSDVFFDEMAIPKPNYNLNINGLGHGAMTGQMLEKIETVLIDESPDLVLVYGDTDSTLAGALAASKLHIKLSHVEAGLRSFNMNMPEEINRILTDRISNYLFCPTEQALNNLSREGFGSFNNCKVMKSGDVMQDAAIFYSSQTKKPMFDIPQEFILCTIHRAENTDNSKRLISIFNAFEKLSIDCKIVLPLHPRTRNKLKSLNYNFENSNIIFIPPVGYLEMVWLLKNCKLVMTDSGGVQKESYFFNKLCITMRDETEWVELVANGYNNLVGADTELIISKTHELLNEQFNAVSRKLYGDGDAGRFIVDNICNN